VSGEDTSASGERRALQRRLQEILWDFICRHWWKVLIALGSFIAGGTVAYVGIYVQLSDARHAAEDSRAATASLKENIRDLKETVAQLVTKAELKAATDRIDRLERQFDLAIEESKTAPHRRK
jgi:prefoldin subunit 5